MKREKTEPTYVADRRNLTLMAVLSATFFPWRTSIIDFIFQDHVVNDCCILDSGCGIGVYSFQLAKRSNCNVLGFDTDSNAILLAQSISKYIDLKGNVKFLVSDVGHFPIPDNSVDLVLCFEVLEHIVDYVTIISEIYRVLRKGGILILSSPVSRLAPLSIDWFEKKLFGRLSIDTYSEHISRFDPSELLGSLWETGFKVTRIRFDAQYLQPLLTFIISKKRKRVKLNSINGRSKILWFNFKNILCMLVARLEYMLFNGLKFGSNILISCRKEDSR